MLGLAHIVPGTEWTGHSTNWDQEAFYLLDYYRCAAELAYTVRVVDVFKLQSPIVANAMRTLKGTVSPVKRG